MSTTYTVALLAVLVVVALARLLLPGLPVRRLAVPLGGVGWTLLLLGLLGLAFHCGAMFFRSTVTAIPGTDGAVSAIDALGTTSAVAYLVAAVLVMAGLRRVWIVAFLLDLVALAAVGWTMYDGGPTVVHTSVIFAAVVVLALTLALVTGEPDGRAESPGPARRVPGSLSGPRERPGASRPRPDTPA